METFTCYTKEVYDENCQKQMGYSSTHCGPSWFLFPLQPWAHLLEVRHRKELFHPGQKVAHKGLEGGVKVLVEDLLRRGQCKASEHPPLTAGASLLCQENHQICAAIAKHT